MSTFTIEVLLVSHGSVLEGLPRPVRGVASSPDRMLLPQTVKYGIFDNILSVQEEYPVGVNRCEFSHNPGASSANLVLVVRAPTREGGWFVCPAAANNDPYFHQWESKVPYRCASPPLFRLKFYRDGFL